MRILLSGASGFVGRSLFSYFSLKKCELVPLLRKTSPSGEIGWGAENGSSLEGFDAVIHLAGEPLSLERWSPEKREKILVSRSTGTSTLSHQLARLRHPPSVFISASAVGFYGNRGEELLDERSSSGKGFLAHVCSLWEKGASAIERRGIRTVQARFGMVLGPDGGMLAKMAPLYRLGLGGKLSTGEQWVSWVVMPDLIGAMDHILRTNFLYGPVNIVSPCAVRQKEFCKTLAEILHRPAFFALPSWLLRLRFGMVADELLLSSARVVPQKLCSSGFRFNYPDLKDALRSVFH